MPPDFQVGTAATASVTLPDLPAGTPSDVLVRRPDVRQAEQQLIAANANIGAARAAFFPRITLTAGIGTASSELSGLFEGGSWGWTAAPQLLLPIFDAGRNRAGLASANGGPRHRGGAVREGDPVRLPRSGRRAGRPRHLRASSCRRSAMWSRPRQCAYRLSELRYNNGVASYLDLLDAQRSLFTARQALVQTQLAAIAEPGAAVPGAGGWLGRELSQSLRSRHRRSSRT